MTQTSDNIRTILITGGSGLIGKKLTSSLTSQGYTVHWLTRDPERSPVKAFRWVVEEQYIDPNALQDVDAIVHLAGENVGGGRWTSSRRKKILNSRIESCALLCRALAESDHQVKVVVAASATGFYGIHPAGGQEEDATPGRDFLAMVTEEWEKAQQTFAVLTPRLVTIRIGIVLSESGGALEKLILPIKYHLGAVLGSGKQMMSWIHIDDLCNIFHQAIFSSAMSGVYNAVAPEAISNKVFTERLASILGRSLWLPPVPPLALKLLLGKMSDMVLGGAQVSCQKLLNTGFQFKFETLDPALRNLLKKN